MEILIFLMNLNHISSLQYYIQETMDYMELASAVRIVMGSVTVFPPNVSVIVKWDIQWWKENVKMVRYYKYQR